MASDGSSAATRPPDQVTNTCGPHMRTTPREGPGKVPWRMQHLVHKGSESPAQAPAVKLHGDTEPPQCQAAVTPRLPAPCSLLRGSRLAIPYSLGQNKAGLGREQGKKSESQASPKSWKQQFFSIVKQRICISWDLFTPLSTAICGSSSVCQALGWALEVQQ